MVDGTATCVCKCLLRPRHKTCSMLVDDFINEHNFVQEAGSFVFGRRGSFMLHVLL